VSKDEVKRNRRVKKEINQLKPILEKISVDDVVKSVREDRDSR
jgi:hypothetical protein